MEFALHHPLDLVSLVQAQQTVVHKDAGEPVAHGLCSRAAATALSTPPERASSTRLSPIFSRHSRRAVST